jgi:hypothetical protein
VLQNRVLRRIFGPERGEVTGRLQKLRNNELHNLHSSPDIIRVIKSRRKRWAGHVAHMRAIINAYKILVGKPEKKRPLGRPRRGKEDNIKMKPREVGMENVDWINLAQERDRLRAVVETVMNLGAP